MASQSSSDPPIPSRPPITPPVPQTHASKRRNAEAVTARIDEPNVIPWYHSTVLWGIIYQRRAEARLGGLQVETTDR